LADVEEAIEKEILRVGQKYDDYIEYDHAVRDSDSPYDLPLYSFPFSPYRYEFASEGGGFWFGESFGADDPDASFTNYRRVIKIFQKELTELERLQVEAKKRLNRRS